MSLQPEDAETYPRYMMAEDEREDEEARAAAGYPPPLPEAERALLQATLVARARERIAQNHGDFLDRVVVAAAEKRAASEEMP